MTTYQLYGLDLESELAFPELPSGPPSGAEVVRLALGELRSPRPADSDAEHWFGATEGEAWFDWRDVAVVRLRGGEEITVQPAPGVDAGGLRFALLGPAFSVLLAQRGLAPLHASAVDVDGRAVAFCGPAGAGKSTLALTFHEHGHPFLADDVAAIDVSAHPPVCRPGFPQCKLSPDFYERRAEDWRQRPRVNPIEEKRAHAIEGARGGQGLPLERVYLLEEGEHGIDGPLPAREALFETMRHFHRPQILEGVLTHPGLLRCAAALAGSVSFYRLSRPCSLDELPEVVRRVARHAAP